MIFSKYSMEGAPLIILIVSVVGAGAYSGQWRHNHHHAGQHKPIRIKGTIRNGKSLHTKTRHHGVNEVSHFTCSDRVDRKPLTMMTVSRIKTELIETFFKDKLDRFASVVRTAFHDCVGGCDGCLNRANPENLGFSLNSLAVLDQIYDSKFQADLSRADLWVLSAVTAMEESLKFNNANLTSNFIYPA